MKKLIITGTILGIASITGMLISAIPVEVESEPIKSVKEVKEVKKVEPVIEKEQPVQDPVVVTPEPVKQPEPTPPVEQTPEQMTIRQIADTMQFESYKEQRILCAERYDSIYGFKDEIDTTREQGIRNFLNLRGMPTQNGGFVITPIMFYC